MEGISLHRLPGEHMFNLDGSPGYSPPHFSDKPRHLLGPGNVNQDYFRYLREPASSGDYAYSSYLPLHHPFTAKDERRNFNCLWKNKSSGTRFTCNLVAKTSSVGEGASAHNPGREWYNKGGKHMIKKPVELFWRTQRTTEIK